MTETGTPHVGVSRDGLVLRVELQRPQAANAVNREMLTVLQSVLARARDDSGIGAVLLCSAGRAFCGGVDLKEVLDPVPALSQRLRREGLGQALVAMASFPKPLVIAVQGPAVGAGCMLAFMADELVAGEAASFSLPEVALGMPTPIAATLAQWRGGPTLARHLVLANGKCGATDPRIGAVAPEAGTELVAFAARRAAELASQPAHALGPTKTWLARPLLEQLELAIAETHSIAERSAR